MKYLLSFLVVVVLVAGFMQMRTWGYRRVVYLEQVAELDHSRAEKVRIMQLPHTNPEERVRLGVETDRLRDNAYECNRLIIETLRAKPYGLPLNSNEQVALAEATARMDGIDKEKTNEDLQRRQAAIEAEARRRGAHQQISEQAPKPGDWMWKDRPTTTMDKAYKRF